MSTASRRSKLSEKLSARPRSCATSSYSSRSSSASAYRRKETSRLSKVSNALKFEECTPFLIGLNRKFDCESVVKFVIKLTAIPFIYSQAR